MEKLEILGYEGYDLLALNFTLYLDQIEQNLKNSIPMGKINFQYTSQRK